MKITEEKIPVRDLAQDYWEKNERGVFGYGGRLNIRPPYQRQFVYKGAQQAAVIQTVAAGYHPGGAPTYFPLNLIYWAKLLGGDFDYETMDGQQRTISICRYVDGGFAVGGLFGRRDNDAMAFYNLPADQQAHILDYPLTVYVCEGTDSEKLMWFERINIAGEQQSPQELRSAVFSGPWVSAARRDFCSGGNASAAHRLGGNYMKGKIDRQEYLETVLKWIGGGNTDEAIRNYMRVHQHDRDAEELWAYFKSVIRWVQAVFPEENKLMRGLAWGDMHRAFGAKFTAAEAPKLQREVNKLLADDEVQRRQGIWEYVLTRDEKHLNLRLFDDEQKAAAYAKQDKKCKVCMLPFALKEMQADHITPWVKGGKTELENCQMLCKKCHDHKTAAQARERAGK